MFSMAGASLFLPFLPLLPTQILLINLLTDFPEMTIAGVNVDLKSVQAPRRRDIGFIRRFMVVFGLLHKPAALFAKNIRFRHQGLKFGDER
jgi:P-type Mg2+ transporter